jgi:prepilin-type N-terminal cleavage/methylation domain-containing protein
MNSARRRGFSLVEMLCVMALLAVIGVVMAVLLREILDVERIQASAFDQMLQRNALADQFRADVAQADKVLPQWRDYASGADSLILEQGKDCHVVYRWNEGTLKRKIFEGAEELERVLPVGGKQIRVEFIETGATMVRLRLHTLQSGKAASGRTVEIAAALAGETP